MNKGGTGCRRVSGARSDSERTAVASREENTLVNHQWWLLVSRQTRRYRPPVHPEQRVLYTPTMADLEGFLPSVRGWHTRRPRWPRHDYNSINQRTFTHHDGDKHERLDDVSEDQRRVRQAVTDVVLKKKRELQHAFLHVKNSTTITNTRHHTHANPARCGYLDAQKLRAIHEPHKENSKVVGAGIRRS